MGNFDIFCFICGNPCHKMILDSNNQNIINFSKKTKWMNNCSILLNNNTIQHNCIEEDYNINFRCKNNKNYLHNPNYFFEPERTDINGIFIHTDCWKWCYHKFNIKLSYNLLPITKNMSFYKVFNFIDYGEIEKYWKQDFDFLKLVNDKKEYLCSSPLNNDKNIKQIINNFRKLKIRTNDRKSPSVSATFYENDSYKIGNNNNIWICKNGKWRLTGEKTIKLKINKIPEKILYNIDYIGGYSKIPIFIEKEKYILILLESYKKNLL